MNNTKNHIKIIITTLILTILVVNISFLVYYNCILYTSKSYYGFIDLENYTVNFNNIKYHVSKILLLAKVNKINTGTLVAVYYSQRFNSVVIPEITDVYLLISYKICILISIAYLLSMAIPKLKEDYIKNIKEKGFVIEAKISAIAGLNKKYSIIICSYEDATGQEIGFKGKIKQLNNMCQYSIGDSIKIYVLEKDAKNNNYFENYRYYMQLDRDNTDNNGDKNDTAKFD